MRICGMNIPFTQESNIQVSNISKKTLCKVAAVAFAALALLGGYYQAEPKAIVIHENPIPAFPESIARNRHAGLVYNRQGDMFCSFPRRKTTTPHKTCDTFTEQFKRKQDGLLNSISISEKGANDRGYLLGLPGSAVDVLHVKLNPQKYKNYKDAIRYLEISILDDPSFFQKTTVKIEQTLRTTHNLMSKYLGKEAQGYRVNEVIVFRDMPDFKPETTYKKIISNGGTEEDIQIFHGVHKRAAEAGSFDAIAGSLTAKEHAAWSFLGYVAPSPHQIPKLMNQFAHEIKDLGNKVLSKQISPIDAAAEIHMAITRIHPFADGNGGLARLYANIFLQLGGIRAPLYPDDATYTTAVEEDDCNPGTFAKYLEGLLLDQA